VIELPPVKEEEPFLSAEEIKTQALDDRRKRARIEQFAVTLGDMFKGDHLLTTPKGRQYHVTLHDPAGGEGEKLVTLKFKLPGFKYSVTTHP
jgi:hypothetical protein